ncbi:hypothetical protein AWENTII_009454 [Aspergillus wentii]
MGDDEFPWTSEEGEWVNPLWGHDPLARAIAQARRVNSVDQTREILSQGVKATPAALVSAIDEHAVDTVDFSYLPG